MSERNAAVWTKNDGRRTKFGRQTMEYGRTMDEKQMLHLDPTVEGMFVPATYSQSAAGFIESGKYVQPKSGTSVRPERAQVIGKANPRQWDSVAACVEYSLLYLEVSVERYEVTLFFKQRWPAGAKGLGRV